MKEHLSRLIDIALGLLLLLPLFYISLPTWQEYIRLFVLAIGLACFWRKYYPTSSVPIDGAMGRVLIVFLAVRFIFIVTQFDPATGGSQALDRSDHLNGSFLASSSLILVAFGAYGLPKKVWSARLDLLDRVVIVIVLLGIGLMAGARLVFGKELSWIVSLKFVFYLMLWFVVTRSVHTRVVSRNRLLAGMLGVLAVVCLGGCIRVGTAFYHYQSGEKSQHKNADVALDHYRRAQELGRVLGLEALRDASLFREAGILFRQGEKGKAAKRLSMEEGFSYSIQPREWEGPAGGILYKHISCWKDLRLFHGKVEIQIFARGQSALDIWPRMRVKLGDEILGEVEVESGEVRPYLFLVEVESGLQRLEISFLNDFHDLLLNSDRNLWVEQAEIHYREIDWE